MERPQIIFGVYVGLLFIFLLLVAITPYIAFTDKGSATNLYTAFGPTCHQKLSRSLCLFENGGINDCTNQSGAYVANDRALISNVKDGILGFKFPVCARDIGIYGVMFVGALAYPFVFKLDEKKFLPPIILVLAIIPIALDGGIQFLSDIGINLIGDYESTNLIRLVTGGIAGFAASFFVIPILNRMFG
jgi:uncharacterized membrane protein